MWRNPEVLIKSNSEHFRASLNHENALCFRLAHFLSREQASTLLENALIWQAGFNDGAGLVVLAAI